MRIGEHDQTAFALGLMIDYARGAKNEDFLKLTQGEHFFFRTRIAPWPMSLPVKIFCPPAWRKQM